MSTEKCKSETSDDYVRGQWFGMLQFMLLDFRRQNPDDPRTDRELLNSLMDHFVESGLVEKQDGKYVISELV